MLEACDLQLVVCSFWLRLVAGILWLVARGSQVNKNDLRSLEKADNEEEPQSEIVTSF